MWETSHSYGGVSFCVVVMVFEKIHSVESVELQWTLIRTNTSSGK